MLIMLIILAIMLHYHTINVIIVYIGDGTEYTPVPEKEVVVALINA